MLFIVTNQQKIVIKLCCSPVAPLFVFRPTNSLFCFTLTPPTNLRKVSAQQQPADTVSNQLVNIVEHLAAKEPDISDCN